MIIFKQKLIIKNYINNIPFKLYRKFYSMVDNGTKKDLNIETKPKQKTEKNSKVVNYVEKYKREEVDNVLNRRFFVIPSYQIYGGVAGFFDYGPPGCALKNNIESFWREHFILEENMLELCGPCLTPEVVLKTSVYNSNLS
jgi:glycyl-tRNA synthetase